MSLRPWLGRSNARRLEAAFRDYDIEAILECLTPDAEIPCGAQLEGKSYVGAAGIRAMVADLMEDWGQIDQRMEEYRGGRRRDGHAGRPHAKSNQTGIDLDVPVAWVLRFEDDLIAFGKAYSDPAEALRAAGLEE